GGEENNRHLGEKRVRADLLRDIAAVDFRHDDIEEDNIRLELARGEPRFGSVVFLEYDKAPRAFEGQFEEPGKTRFVVHNEDTFFLHEGGQLRAWFRPETSELRGL